MVIRMNGQNGNIFNRLMNDFYRSMFYTSLGRLLMVDLGEDEEKFDAFMMPLTQSFESLGQVLLNQSSGYNSEEVI